MGFSINIQQYYQAITKPYLKAVGWGESVSTFNDDNNIDFYNIHYNTDYCK